MSRFTIDDLTRTMRECAGEDDSVDHAVGVCCLKKRGDVVDAGDVLAEIHARTRAAADSVANDVLAAYTIGAEPPNTRPIVLETIE